jgi:methionyl-tRNA formyltransferase
LDREDDLNGKGTTRVRVDLFLGSDIGLWAIGEVDPTAVGGVVTEDDEIAANAIARGFAVTRAPSGADRALSVHYPHVLSAELLARYKGAWNLHPAFLPWGRGHFPLVWAIANREPAGGTLHEMTSRLDGGPIVDQIEVVVEPAETGGSLHARVREVERDLFRRWWPRIAGGEPIPARPQPPGGSYHDRRAFDLLMALDADELAAGDLDRIGRALSFPGKPGLTRGGSRPRSGDASEAS